MSWQLGLTRLASLVGRDLQRPARHAGGGEQLWRAGSATLERLLRLDADLLATVRAWRRTFDAAAEIAALGESGLRWVQIGDGDYPPALAEIPDPPFGLFTCGAPLSLTSGRGRPIVGIVGSRRATASGLRFARALAADLAARGALVLSGLALGIDAEAHEGALMADEPTVAVLGSGVDVIHPRRNTALRHRIAATGTLVSEYWPGTAPAPWRFPARNRKRFPRNGTTTGSTCKRGTSATGEECDECNECRWRCAPGGAPALDGAVLWDLTRRRKKGRGGRGQRETADVTPEDSRSPFLSPLSGGRGVNDSPAWLRPLPPAFAAMWRGIVAEGRSVRECDFASRSAYRSPMVPAAWLVYI